MSLPQHQIMKFMDCAAPQLVAKCKIVETLILKGNDDLKTLIAHELRLGKIFSAKLNCVKSVFPDFENKIRYTIENEIDNEKEKIGNTLKELDRIYQDFIKTFDKVFQIYHQNKSKLSFEELTEADEMSFSIARKLEAFHELKQAIWEDHITRKYASQHCLSFGEFETIQNLWSIKDISLAKEDFACIMRV